MALKSNLKKSKKPTRNTVDVDNIELMDDDEIPAALKSSKYPWEKLADAEPRKKSFFVACDDKEEAVRLRPAVYSSGRQYYLKRKIDRIPIVRVKQIDDTWGVAAWCDETED